MAEDRFEVKFAEWLQEGYELYKNNFMLLFLVNLIALVISAVSATLLAGPMIAGVLMITLALYDKKSPPPEVGDVFKGFSYFLNTFLFVIIWEVVIMVVSVILNVIPILGQAASVFLGFAAPTLLMFAMFLIVDRKMDFWPASMESINKVKQYFWPLLGLYVVTEIIVSLGAVACCIGVFVTAPFGFAVMTVAYRNAYPKRNGSPDTSSGYSPVEPTSPVPETAIESSPDKSETDESGKGMLGPSDSEE